MQPFQADQLTIGDQVLVNWGRFKNYWERTAKRPFDQSWYHELELETNDAAFLVDRISVELGMAGVVWQNSVYGAIPLEYLHKIY